MTLNSAPYATVPRYLITGGTGITAPEFTTYAPALWNYGASRHLTPDKRSGRRSLTRPLSRTAIS